MNPYRTVKFLAMPWMIFCLIGNPLWKVKIAMVNVKDAYHAYSEGYDAYFNGVKFSDNPYNKKQNKLAYKNWRNGWNAADSSSSESRYHEWK